MNEITSCCVSADKTKIVTADSGKDSMIIMWDGRRGSFIKSYSEPHLGGVLTMDMSPNGRYLVTLSKYEESEQKLALWDLLEDSTTPFLTSTIENCDVQFNIRFSPTFDGLMVSNGKKDVIFWSWNTVDGISFKIGDRTPRGFKHTVGSFSKTLYIPFSDMAVSGTDEGDIVLWGIDSGFEREDERVILKLIR